MAANSHSRAVSALKLIFGGCCDSYTTGPGSCIRTNRKRKAKYSADQWCRACIAYDALKQLKEIK